MGIFIQTTHIYRFIAAKLIKLNIDYDQTLSKLQA
jgi:hypothetical protein